MFRNLVALTLCSLAALCVTGLVGAWRTRRAHFSGHWWDMEGCPIFILAFFAALIAAGLSGCLHSPDP